MHTSSCLFSIVLCTVFFSCSDSNNFRQEPDTTIPVEEDKTNPSLIVNGDMEDDISMDLKKRGMSFVGSITIYSYLQAIGIVDDHELECFCYKH